MIGSSPRGRGTGVNARAGSFVDRFIPAWAGNSDLLAGVWMTIIAACLFFKSRA